MPSLTEILNDREKYADTLTMRIGDQEVPLSSLRQLNASEQEALKSAIAAAQGKEQELNRRQTEVVELSKKAADAYTAAEELRNSAASGNNPLADPFADPWLAPVKKELEGRDATIKELREQLATYGKVVSNAANIFAEDRWDSEYSRLDFGKREKRPTRDEIRDFAVKNRLTDRHGLPSLSKAWEEMSKGDREAELKKAEFDRGVEAGRQQQMASRLPTPGVPGASGVPNAKDIVTADGHLNSSALYDQVLKDPELKAMVEQLPPGLM